MLDAGAAVDAPRSATGDTALHVATREVDLELMRLLLEHGADPQAEDNSGRTPLFRLPGWCSEPERSRLVPAAELLLEHGALLDHVAHDGWMPSTAWSQDPGNPLVAWARARGATLDE